MSCSIRSQAWMPLAVTVGMLLLPTTASAQQPETQPDGATQAETTGQIDVGDAAVDFKLPIVGTEEFVTLSDEYKQGPVVLVVLRGYPGYQCPLCSRQVAALSRQAKEFATDAEKVILVYPGEASLLDEHAEEFMGSRTLPEPLVIVRDEGMKMVNQWGLRWNAPRETAYPSTFVIDTDGKVKWKKISDSHGGRSDVEQVLAEVRKL